MRKKILLISPLALCLLYSSLLSAQKTLPKSELEVDLDLFAKKNGLVVGDIVPDIKFQMLNHSKSTAKLSDFKGKLVILDFWATWCSSCIANFPKLESLQSSFKGKIQVLLVNSTHSTGEELSKVDDFLKKRKIKGKPIKLSTAIEDSSAVKLFPHNELPHYVWISPEGKVEAITASDEVTQDNIQKSLNGEIVKLRGKRDYFRDRIFGFGEMPIDRSTRYFFFKKGRLTGIGSYNHPRTLQESNGKSLNVGKALYNQPLLDIYEAALLISKDDFRKFYSKKRTIIKVSDSTNLFYDPTRFTKDDWESDNLYTCDVVVQPSEVPNLRDIILNYLNISTGYWGRIEKRKVSCLTIVNMPEFVKGEIEKNDTVRHSQDDRYIFSNEAVSIVVYRLNSSENSLPFIVDGTKLKDRVNLAINLENPDLENLKSQLNKQGYDIVKEERELDMFILSDNVNKQTVEK